MDQLPTQFLDGFLGITGGFLRITSQFFSGPQPPRRFPTDRNRQPRFHESRRLPRYPKMQYVGMELLTCGRGTESSRVPPDFYCPLGLQKNEFCQGRRGGKLEFWNHFGVVKLKTSHIFMMEDFHISDLS